MKLVFTFFTGSRNALPDLFHDAVKTAIDSNEALVFAFGRAWDDAGTPEADSYDEYFHFRPQAGIHDIHMNQGNKGRWEHENAPFQDGALFIRYPYSRRWLAVFLAFQSQSFDPVPV